MQNKRLSIEIRIRGRQRKARLNVWRYPRKLKGRNTYETKVQYTEGVLNQAWLSYDESIPGVQQLLKQLLPDETCLSWYFSAQFQRQFNPYHLDPRIREAQTRAMRKLSKQFWGLNTTKQLTVLSIRSYYHPDAYLTVYWHEGGYRVCQWHLNPAGSPTPYRREVLTTYPTLNALVQDIPKWLLTLSDKL